MGELKWLDGYANQSRDELLALETEYRTDSLVLAFEQALGQKAAQIGVENLTEEERIVLAIEALEREVSNGGYDQFFINSSKEYASIIVAALNRIGCSEAAAITRDAICALRIDGKITVEAIDRVMDEEDEQREDRFNEYDDRYYEIAGGVADQLLRFIKNNKTKVNLS